MTRRSTRLMRSENSLYTYNANKESWYVRKVKSQSNVNIQNRDFFELGSFFTCKHMSQKVNPISFRLNTNKTWNSAWYSTYKDSDIKSTKLQKDLYIRQYLKTIFKGVNILTDKIQIKEHNNIFFVKIFIHGKLSNNLPLRESANQESKRKDMIKSISQLIDKDNSDLLTKYLKTYSSSFNLDNIIVYAEMQLKYYLDQSIYISVCRTNDIGDSASLLSSHLVTNLEQSNTSFKRALKDSLSKIKNNKAIRGLRVNCSGRLGRAPMAKMEWFKFGSIPLTKISALVDYSYSTGKTKYGSFGIKVWVYKY